MTHSEISYENQKSSSSTHISSSTSANFASKESSSSTSTLRDGESMKRKLQQLQTIEKEIDRLAQIKEKVQLEMRKTKNTEKIYENINFKEKGRSRLGTPTSLDNNLVQRKENFMEQYVNQHGKLYDSVDSVSKNYTKPYGTTGKSASDNERLRKLSSRASSGASGTSNRPYVEPKKHTETQTTDSLRRISPYFENKSPEDAQKPQIINKTQINKQIQTNCQQAQAYSIVFDKDFVPKENDERLPGQTLKEYLGEKRPKILQAMDERNECIKELRRLRQLRNEQRQKLLLLTSETCLKEKLRKLPPPPLAQKRLFSTRALKLHSLKQYQNLPEVLKKKEVEKLNNLKRKHRVLLDMFNKNLQQKVLQGKTDLSYNFNLFTNTK
ncbi:centrosome-associated protein Alms1a-like [Culicoides brevitarsis]|uniref:centrosome-associated protein Alms1a-like n=1 Tax=Culicoides brevitarsis TaxID=469753 RepID=UPI00307C894C